jgi:hypothetical protein
MQIRIVSPEEMRLNSTHGCCFSFFKIFSSCVDFVYSFNSLFHRHKSTGDIHFVLCFPSISLSLFEFLALFTSIRLECEVTRKSIQREKKNENERTPKTVRGSCWCCPIWVPSRQPNATPSAKGRKKEKKKKDQAT